MQKVIVTVTGSQRGADGEESRIELTAAGTSREKNGVRYVTYKDGEASGMARTATLLKICSDRLCLVRTGTVEQRQDFCPGRKSCGSYRTPLGELQLGIFTRLFTADSAGGVLTVEVVYDLEINGRWQSANRLLVKIREEAGNGCKGITC